ncbi:MAG: hypothetical protein Q8O84_00435 [Nanoarchaeota archaeon]|nr:hypothetical protein [Nanoarchaeota archaeon]
MKKSLIFGMILISVILITSYFISAEITGDIVGLQDSTRIRNSVSSADSSSTLTERTRTGTTFFARGDTLTRRSLAVSSRWTLATQMNGEPCWVPSSGTSSVDPSSPSLSAPISKFNLFKRQV